MVPSNFRIEILVFRALLGALGSKGLLTRKMLEQTSSIKNCVTNTFRFLILKKTVHDPTDVFNFKPRSKYYT